MATEPGGYKGGHLLAAFIVGAAAGAVLTYLTVPDSDRRRKVVKGVANSARRAAREVPGRLRDSVTKAVDAARSVLEDALDAGRNES